MGSKNFAMGGGARSVSGSVSPTVADDDFILSLSSNGDANRDEGSLEPSPFCLAQAWSESDDVDCRLTKHGQNRMMTTNECLLHLTQSTQFNCLECLEEMRLRRGAAARRSVENDDDERRGAQNDT